MATRHDDVDAYIRRSERWPNEIAALRPVLLGCGLSEELKWAKPCYSHGAANVVVVQEMKNFLALMFFKGVLLEDVDGVLEPNGPNSRSASRMCFRSVEDVERLADTVAAYVREAVQLEEDGVEVGPPPELVLVEELQARLDGDATLRSAFEALTPGRQREYHLHISGAKQASTRESRVDTCVPKILDGRGLRDR
ncbi:MAG: YdeI/OmpD-associated family protein [Ilumatobacter sp.]|uniref:YdeI/OmpD-associated family protein n=1 Tax=Ilumatobacter sp. TaxID=1967498 RepID=UPI003C7333ED